MLDADRVESEEEEDFPVQMPVTYMDNHSWSHHFESLGYHATRFMSRALSCLLTNRAMQCSEFLNIPWPNDRDTVLDREEVESLIREAYPNGAVAYLLD